MMPLESTVANPQALGHSIKRTPGVLLERELQICISPSVLVRICPFKACWKAYDMGYPAMLSESPCNDAGVRSAVKSALIQAEPPA